MRVEVKVTAEPLDMPPVCEPGCGAVVRFDGIVRGIEGGSPVSALVYEAYQPMAESVMRDILQRLHGSHPFALARVFHRVGTVPVGQAAVVVEIHSAHRAEALAAVGSFLDQLKKDVPIWKVAALPETENEANSGSRKPGEIAGRSGPPLPETPGQPNLTEIEELWTQIDGLTPVLGSEWIPVEQAAGRVLAESVAATLDLPPFDHSAMDGYAFAEATPGSCRVRQNVAAGDSVESTVCPPGTAFRILTGAPVPSGVWGIVRQEDCEIDGEEVRIKENRPVSQGENIRRRGSVASAGELLMEKGTRIEPGAVAFMAAGGISRVKILCKPRILHLATGAELVDPGVPLTPGKITDSNGPMMQALLERGGLSVERRRLADDLDDLIRAIRFFDGDLLLISGGSGPGDHDHTAAALVAGGFTIHTSRLNSRPGKPLLFASRPGAVAFGLPGNPLSHWVCFHAFVRRALARLTGEKPQELLPTYCRHPLGQTIDRRRTWTPAILEINGGRAGTRPLPWKHSGDLSPLVAANAILLDTPDPQSHLVPTLLL